MRRVKVSKTTKRRLKIKDRKENIRIEDLPISSKLDSQIEYISKSLAKQIDWEIFKKKYAPVADILKLVGMGLFLASAVVIPNLPIALKPLLVNEDEKELWKKFNVPYLKRTLRRLEKQKLVEIGEEQGSQVVRITSAGQRRILRYALDEVEIKRPKIWDGRWRLVSYDIPKEFKNMRDIFRRYLNYWGFYQLHESVFLHAYPCEKEVEFLREYLGIGEYVRILKVAEIENDKHFREFFGV